MDLNNLFYAPATDLIAALRRREVSSVEVTRAYLDRLVTVNPYLNSVVQFAPESAMEQARATDDALLRGDPIGPLHGLPFTVKDVYAITPEIARLEPMPGMPPRKDDVPNDHVSPVVRRLRNAGAILIAVTRATLWDDREAHYGPVHNPYDRTRSCSGSSGGEAALVAAGGTPLGFGTDSGGSLRIPAHCSGIVTIRPSNGRVPRATDGAGTNDPRTVAGPLTRSVADAALALQVIAGYTPEDPTTLPLPPFSPLPYGVRGLRIGFFYDNGIASPTPAVRSMIADTAQALSAGGAIVEPIELPDALESWAVTKEYWRWCGEEGNVADYIRFLERWDRYRVKFLSFMQHWDALLCPTEAFAAPPIPDPGGIPAFTYTTPFSLTGVPCAVVRAGTSAEGLPLTVQVIAGPLQDDTALSIAGVIEETCSGYQPPPPLP